MDHLSESKCNKNGLEVRSSVCLFLRNVWRAFLKDSLFPKVKDAHILKFPSYINLEIASTTRMENLNQTESPLVQLS